MAGKILFVDDNLNILAGFQRQLRKLYTIEIAQGGEQGLEVLSQKGPFSVVVSDLRMPGMDGVRFLSQARKAAPDTIRMVLTGYADLQTAIDAVNEGNIFRFLTKPCSTELLSKALDAGIRQYELIRAEHELLQNTLRGAVKVLSGILQLVNPEAFGRAARITRNAKAIAREMGLPGLWQIETAASLSQIGCVVLPEGSLRKVYSGQQLTSEEAQVFSMHPIIASDLIAQIPRMGKIAEMIAKQDRDFGSASQDPDDETYVPPGSRILRVVLDFDILQARGVTESEAIEVMLGRPGRYDPAVLAVLKTVLGFEPGYERVYVRAEELEDGMILDEDVFMQNDHLLVARGYRVNLPLREKIKAFAVRPGIREPFRVLVREKSFEPARIAAAKEKRDS
ncbi:MAG: response regulator [Desulfobacteraceae bacterium]|nr:response regulator [Desulfobacteraceae bacterium]